MEGEKILQSVSEDVDVVVLGCPTIVDAGRLGLLAILFEFIDKGSTRAGRYGAATTATSSSTLLTSPTPA